VDSIIGKTLGKYQILELIGRGATAEVYKAYQPVLDRYVAIKIIHSFLAEDKGFLDRFQREAQAAAQLRHPNIVRVYDFDVLGGVYYYMVMEFIDGPTLHNELQRRAAANEIMALENAIHIVKDVTSALSYAHSRGMIHRDIKPSNVVINQENKAILTDFGMAKIVSDAQYTATGMITGTPNYMPPEQGLGKSADARSDIYSLGTMFFQMVTGRLPYYADSAVTVLLKHINDPIPIPTQANPALPSTIDSIILKAMAKDPGDRYQTAQEFLEHLRRIETASSPSDTALLVFSAAPPTHTDAPTRQHSNADTQSTSAMSASTTPPFSGALLEPASPGAALPAAFELTPYTLSPGLVATDPADLPAMCDANWQRAVDHFAKGYITAWLREAIDRLRAAYQHGLADEVELIAARAEAIVRRIQDGDDIAHNVGLEEFLESLGAPPPIMDIAPPRLDLPAVGVGEAGQTATLTITNKGRGYLFGRIVCRVPWLDPRPRRFGGTVGQLCTITVRMDVSGLPASRIQSPDAVQVRTIGGDRDIPVQVNILPSALRTDASTLDFGTVGQGEATQATFTLRNGGRGYLIGRVRCREPWLTALPQHFKVPAGESIQVVVSADSQALPTGEVVHDWALVIESNGGHAVLDLHMIVLPPRLEVEPAQIRLPAVDLAEPRPGRSAELTVRNAGPGILTGAVKIEGDWLTAKPAAFRCRSGEAQQLRLSTTQLRLGDLDQSVHVVSNAGTAEVPVLLQVRFSTEPEMVHVPAGEFLRGSREQDRHALASEKPQGQIHIDEYWIARYPVTNAHYAAFARATGRRPPDDWEGDQPPPGKESHPVVNVSWWDAVAYCRWLAELTGKPYRLPTEAQWEKAARGTDGRVYPWGNRWDSQKCNSREGHQGGTSPVGTYSPAGDSPFGCADMVGNVLEWVADWYHEEYYARSSVDQNPYGPSSGVIKVLRGGSWSADRWGVRCTSRYQGNRKATSPEAGFRCALFASSKSADSDHASAEDS
jgi:serine/threonine protein kinase/formylglycine-generating enzyme required for sulfatase activity